MNSIAYANREEVICSNCNKGFWPSSTSIRICSSCTSKSGNRVSRETENTRNAIRIAGFWFAPVLILGISSKIGMMIHSLISEIIPAILMGIGFVIATWMTLMQWSFSKTSE